MKAFVPLDGTPPPIDRIAADRPLYSGKHKKHGMNARVITDPSGRLLWLSPALPGAVHDVSAAREHGIVDALAQADIPRWADKGYLVEQAVAILKSWRLLRKLRCSTTRITSLVQAVPCPHLATSD